MTFVNAPQLATTQGVTWDGGSSIQSPDYVSLMTVRTSAHTVSRARSTTVGTRTEPRIVAVDDHAVEIPPAPHMLVVRNDDRPGMIGFVGTELGERGGLHLVDGRRAEPLDRDGPDGALVRPARRTPR